MVDIYTLAQAEQAPQPSLGAVVDDLPGDRQHRHEGADENDEGHPAIALQQGFRMGTRKAMKRQAQENVRRHPGPTGVPAVEQGQDDAEPDPVERDPAGLRVADEEEERRSRQASENAPPAVVPDEEMAEVVDRDQDDRGGLQPVGIVNGYAQTAMRRARRGRGGLRSLVHFRAQS
jgi:hypothetical protein